MWAAHSKDRGFRERSAGCDDEENSPLARSEAAIRSLWRVKAVFFWLASTERRLWEIRDRAPWPKKRIGRTRTALHRAEIREREREKVLGEYWDDEAVTTARRDEASHSEYPIPSHCFSSPSQPQAYQTRTLQTRWLLCVGSERILFEPTSQPTRKPTSASEIWSDLDSTRVSSIIRFRYWDSVDRHAVASFRSSFNSSHRFVNSLCRFFRSSVSSINSYPIIDQTPIKRVPSPISPSLTSLFRLLTPRIPLFLTPSHLHYLFGAANTPQQCLLSRSDLLSPHTSWAMLRVLGNTESLAISAVQSALNQYHNRSVLGTSVQPIFKNHRTVHFSTVKSHFV